MCNYFCFQMTWLCVENLKQSTKKLLFAKRLKVAAYKVNILKSIIFLSTSNEELEFEIKNTTLFTLAVPQKWNT